MLEVRAETIDQQRADGLDDLQAAHWEEVALNKDAVPLAMDWAQYHALEKAGALKAFALRADGELIGYNWFFVSPHMHYGSTVFAINDIIYVDPDWRKRGAGLRLIRGTERLLRKLDVVVVQYHTKAHVLADRGTIGKVLARLGYADIGAIHAKRLR